MSKKTKQDPFSAQLNKFRIFLQFFGWLKVILTPSVVFLGMIYPILDVELSIEDLLLNFITGMIFLWLSHRIKKAKGNLNLQLYIILLLTGIPGFISLISGFWPLFALVTSGWAVFLLIKKPKLETKKHLSYMKIFRVPEYYILFAIFIILTITCIALLLNVQNNETVDEQDEIIMQTYCQKALSEIELGESIVSIRDIPEITLLISELKRAEGKSISKTSDTILHIISLYQNKIDLANSINDEKGKFWQSRTKATEYRYTSVFADYTDKLNVEEFSESEFDQYVATMTPLWSLQHKINDSILNAYNEIITEDRDRCNKYNIDEDIILDTYYNY